MVFLNWQELPWYWYGFDQFWFAALMVVLVPGLLAFVFGWFAFRSPRHRRLSLDHHPGADLRAAARLLPQRHGLRRQQRPHRLQGHPRLPDPGADDTRAALFAASALALALGVLVTSAIVRSKLRQGARRRPRRREPHPLPRLPRRARQALRLRRLRLHGRRRRRALRAAGRHHQSRRVRARPIRSRW